MQTTQITVQGKQFTAPQPYTAGHVLNEGEASALNQVLAENLRNNFASKMKNAAEAEGDAKKELTQEDFDAYAQSYKFGVRAGGTRVVTDPVTREARKLAKAAIVAKIKSLGKNVKDYSDDNIEELVAGLLEKRPEFRAQAEVIVNAQKAAVTDVEI